MIEYIKKKKGKTIELETICDYASKRLELLKVKLKKTTNDCEILSISAAMREVDLILTKFCQEK